MPSLVGPTQVLATSHAQWSSFLAHSLATRLPVDKFTQFAPLLAARHPLPPQLVADVLLRPTPANCWSLDPRLPRYLDVLLDDGYVDAAAVLRALWKYSTAHELAPGGDAHRLPDEARGGGEEGLERADGDGADEGHAQADKDGPAAGKQRRTKTGGHAAAAAAPLRWRSSFVAEEGIFYRLTRSVAQGTAIHNARAAVEVVRAMARWMELLAGAETATTQGIAEATAAAAAAAVEDEDEAAMLAMQPVVDADDEEKLLAQRAARKERHGRADARAQALAQYRDDMDAARAAFVMLLLRVSENPIALRTLSQPMAKDARHALSDSLAVFVPSIIQSAQAVAAKLEMFRTQTLASFEPVDKKAQAAKAEIDDILDSTMGLDTLAIPEIRITNSRAGLYIYLSAALVGRPLIDDAAIFNYLHNRYQGDIETITIDLILASFDILANAAFRSETQTHVLRSFLMNKLPLLLVSLSTSMYPPLTAEYCITAALAQVDPMVFPTLSSMFDDSSNSNVLTDSVRSDFCFACCLHGLVLESSIETLLGEISYQTLPAGGRYVKEDLVQQCLSDQERTHGLIGELDNMDGNVGAVCQALTEVIGRLCENGETMTLKSICGQLAKKPLALDVMLLFDKPTTILRPLCDLLDNWKYEDDQGEYQPVYEEFGFILLLLLAFVCRYNLSATDLGLRSPDSFVMKFLGVGHLPIAWDELGEQQKEQMGGWIRGLFDPESGALDDDLMSTCPPQSFYLLVPTLFQDIVGAVSSGVLSEEGLKGGVEYLGLPFLLPSLVMALRYLASALRADRPQDQRAILKILHLILRSSSSSSSSGGGSGGQGVGGGHSSTSEAAGMLSAVLTMTAKPLEHALRTYQKQEQQQPSGKTSTGTSSSGGSAEAEALFRYLRPGLALSRRSGAAEATELELWIGGISTGGKEKDGPRGAASRGDGHHHHASSSSSVSAAPPGSALTSGPLASALRHTVSSVTHWASQPAPNAIPPSYTHRQVLATLRLMGARRTVGVLLDELDHRAELAAQAQAAAVPADPPPPPAAVQQAAQAAHALSVAYDVVVVIICAPDAQAAASLPSPPAQAAPTPAVGSAGPAGASGTPAPLHSSGTPLALPPGDGSDGGNSGRRGRRRAAASSGPNDVSREPTQRREGLREALRGLAEDWAWRKAVDESGTAPHRVENAVRLARRVDAQSLVLDPDAAAVSAAQGLPLHHGLVVGGGVAGPAGGGVGVGVGAGGLDQLSGVDLSAAAAVAGSVGAAMDLGADVMALDADTADMFADLGSAGLLDGWDGMDL